MGMGFAPTWLRQVSPPASQNHFNHWAPSDSLFFGAVYKYTYSLTFTWFRHHFQSQRSTCCWCLKYPTCRNRCHL